MSRSDELKMLFCISDELLGAHTFFVLVISKKRLHLFEWLKDEFQNMLFEGDRTFNEKFGNLRCFDEKLYFSTKDEYFLLKLDDTVIEKIKEVRSWSGELVRMSISSGSQAFVLIPELSLIGLLSGDTLSMFNTSGKKCIDYADIVFSDPPVGIGQFRKKIK